MTKIHFHLMSQSKSVLVLFILYFVMFACKTNTENSEPNSNESLPEEKNIVETVILEKQDFTREIISNGKLAAIQKAELYFKNQGIIETIKVGNGDIISVNAELARLQNDEYRFNVEKAQVNMEKAEIDRLDALLSMGYKTGAENISSEHQKIADIRSGYNQAKIQLAEANQQLENIILKAPFSGKVEGLKQKPFEKADLSKPFCTLINDNRFTIEFPAAGNRIQRNKYRTKSNNLPYCRSKTIRREYYRNQSTY